MWRVMRDVYSKFLLRDRFLAMCAALVREGGSKAKVI
jgi:hypothetical protein